VAFPFICVANSKFCRGIRIEDFSVCPEKAGIFSRGKSCQGKSQRPCSLNGRLEGDRRSEAH
jgi:hypothetical protein